MSDLLMNQEEAANIARGQGYRIVRGTPKRLLLDFDTDEDYQVFKARFALVAGEFAEHHNIVLEIVDEWTSKSGGTHVKIKISQPLPLTTRLLLQACLGSDWKREYLSLRRHMLGSDEPSMLFRPRAKIHAFKQPPRPVANAGWVDGGGVTDDDVLF